MKDAACQMPESKIETVLDPYWDEFYFDSDRDKRFFEGFFEELFDNSLDGWCNDRFVGWRD